MRQLLRILILVSVYTCMAIKSCLGEFGPPVVFNCSSLSVQISILRSDGHIVKIVLSPHHDLWQPLAGAQVTEIQFMPPGSRRYSRNTLTDLKKTKSVARELWVIREGTVDLTDLSYLRSIRASCNEARKSNK